MKQIITRVEDELADALKRQARRTGESVNSYVNRLLRVAVAGPGSQRQMWKAAAVADGRLASRGASSASRVDRWDLKLTTAVETQAGYAAELVSDERDER
ncbi:MAG: hypothetical protein ACYDEP_07640 [Acidimicrobiales bacterium]